MQDLLQNIINHLRWGDIVDLLRTIVIERYEVLIVVVAVVFIMILCLWTILERLGEKGVVALLPAYRFAVLFSKLDLPPLLSLLLLIPGTNLVMRAIFYVKVAQKFERSYFMVPFLYIMPLVFLPIVAMSDGKCPHIRLPKADKQRPKYGKLFRKVKRQKVVRQKQEQQSKINAPVVNPIDEILEEEKKIQRQTALSMAELKEKRTQAKKIKQIPATPVQHKVVKKPAAKADLMPIMQKGPNGRNIILQEKKAELMKESEYERLLRSQTAKAKSRIEQLERIKKSQKVKKSQPAASHGKTRQIQVNTVQEKKPVSKKVKSRGKAMDMLSTPKKRH